MRAGVRPRREPDTGAAPWRGVADAEAPFVILQDADLEYDPNKYGVVLAPRIGVGADVAYGSRFLSGPLHLCFGHSVGNKLLTTVSTMFTDLNLTDTETCDKVFDVEVLRALDLREDRFGIEPGITAEVAGGRWRDEMGISCTGRTHAGVKRIGRLDGVRASACIVRCSPPLAWLRRRRSPTRG